MHQRLLLLGLLCVLLCGCAATNGSRPAPLPAYCAELFRPGGIEDPFDADYATCPDAQGHVSLVSGVTADINGIPDEEMKDLFEDPVCRCDDLFQKGHFAVAMHAIVTKQHLPGDAPESTRAMRAVFASTRLSWDYFDPPVTNGYIIYGCTDLSAIAPAPRIPNVHLYRTLCNANALYGTDLGPIASELRVFLIAAHEIGHVIDHMAGISFIADREIRATVYGSVIAQCRARAIARVLTQLRSEPLSSAPAEERERRRALDCLIAKYHNLEGALASIRATAGTSGSPMTNAIAACAAPATPNAGSPPNLQKCP